MSDTRYSDADFDNIVADMADCSPHHEVGCESMFNCMKSGKLEHRVVGTDYAYYVISGYHMRSTVLYRLHRWSGNAERVDFGTHHVMTKARDEANRRAGN